MTDVLIIGAAADFGRRGTRLRDLVRVADSRYSVEESFQTAKNEVGLSGSPGALLRRGLLRTGQARFSSIRLKQPPRAVGMLRWASCRRRRAVQ
jgi:hypothetical protein